MHVVHVLLAHRGRIGNSAPRKQIEGGLRASTTLLLGTARGCQRLNWHAGELMAPAPWGKVGIRLLHNTERLSSNQGAGVVGLHAGQRSRVPANGTPVCAGCICIARRVQNILNHSGTKDARYCRHLFSLGLRQLKRHALAAVLDRPLDSGPCRRSRSGRLYAS